MAKRLITIFATTLMLLGSTAALANDKYTRIANNSAELDDSVVTLGTGPLDWACTRDNVTGLVWEVKTADGGLRDQAKTYTNYDDVTQAQFFNGTTLVNPTQAQIDAPTNTIGFATAVNGTALCGHADWRRPSKDELLGLVDNAGTPSKINQTYFPNTLSSVFWSASAYSGNSSLAWVVYFYDGYANYFNKNNSGRVRLVRAGQSLATFGLSVGTMGSGAGHVSASGLFCNRESGVSYGTCWSPRPSGEAVTLTATPADGNVFTGWGGACSASGTATTCTLTMNPARAVKASFAKSTATRSIVIDPATPAKVYAALDGSGVYRSTDSGVTWTAASTQPSNLNLKALVIKPGTPATLFAVSYGGGVFKSIDSAANWSTCATQPSNQNLHSLAIDATGRLYAGSEAGVFVSSNDCGTWTAMNTGLPN